MYLTSESGSSKITGNAPVFDITNETTKPRTTPPQRKSIHLRYILSITLTEQNVREENKPPVYPEKYPVKEAPFKYINVQYGGSRFFQETEFVLDVDPTWICPYCVG
jgi:hypothetical protein